MAIQINNVKISIEQNRQDAFKKAMKEARISKEKIDKMYVTKSSVDARKRDNIKIVLSIIMELNIDEEKVVTNARSNNVRLIKQENFEIISGKEKMDTRPVVVGFGPAGMFCGLLLARHGYNPIIIERGDKIEQRVEKVENFWNNGVFDSKTNVQFGEGGAGTFSDGKLTTRISDPRCSFVLKEMVKYGAPTDILEKAKPHIGTDKLRNMVKNIREEIIKLGGDVHFNTQLTDIVCKNKTVTKIKTTMGEFETNNLILAIGHSSRDTFSMLFNNDIFMESKPFSVGVRIEHLQEDINKGLYGEFASHEALPIGEYQLSKRVDGRGVYTFCMCPGGVVVPSSSEEGTVVVNGMSEYARDGKNANSAIAVSVDKSNFGNDVLGGVEFQRKLEQLAYIKGGSNYKAPAQTVGNFLSDKKGLSLGKIKPTYAIGIADADFNEIFPKDIVTMLKIGIEDFGRKIKGFSSPDAIMTGVETRTSSPVKITRGENLNSISTAGLYPCGEGAGYAGGIMSSAVDGIKIAQAIIEKYSSFN